MRIFGIFAVLIAIILFQNCSNFNQSQLGQNHESNSDTSQDDPSELFHKSSNTPGPSSDLFNHNPYYQCVVNRYVATAANGGNDSNDGTSAVSNGNGVGPWLTVQHANDSLPSDASGYCINIGKGVYTMTTSLNIDRGGRIASKTGFVVYRSTDFLGAKLEANSGLNAFIQIHSPYVIIEGLEIDGKRFSSVQAGIDTCFGGTNYNGIHHVIIMNNYIHDVGNSGIGVCWAEFYWVLHNRSENNAYNGWFSGISTYQPMIIPNYTLTDYDKQWTPYHNVYAYNSLNGNFTLPQNGPHTDGNGLIYDDTRHEQSGPNTVYSPLALVMGNIATNNGAAGFQIGPTSANVHVFNNTAYNNQQDTKNTGTWRGELSAAFTSNVIFKNNIGFAKPGTGILSNNHPLNVGNPFDATNDFSNNIFFGADVVIYSPEIFLNQLNQTNTDPKLVDVQNRNFALCKGTGVPDASCSGKSPALGYGIQVPYWHQQTPGQIDVGACSSDLLECH